MKKKKRGKVYLTEDGVLILDTVMGLAISAIVIVFMIALLSTGVVILLGAYYLVCVYVGVFETKSYRYFTIPAFAFIWPFEFLKELYAIMFEEVK